MEWRDFAWEEFKLLQGIINRQMEIRWKIRTWLLTVQGGLVIGLGSKKLDSREYVRLAVAVTLISWLIEMSENFVINECVNRQRSIELTVNKRATTPENVWIPAICKSLEKTEKGFPTLWYIIKSFIRLRRLIVYSLFIVIPVLIWRWWR